jgi:2-keto-4-pentenoate hydratase/2-oxohepta-3-ene-1,7-dioic acid hydratase in catechol pathway
MKFVKWDGKEICPSKIVCIGRNYISHIKELANEVPKEPVIFLKPNSAIADGIHSSDSDVIHFESEISFVIYSGELAAVGFGLDLTKREVQTRLKTRGLPWERAKAFDQSAVFSEFVTFNGRISELRLELYINDRLAQQGGCELMLNKPDEILSEAKSFISFEDGDLIMTGTPAGIGPIKPGQKFTGKIFEKEKLIVKGQWVVK